MKPNENKVWEDRTESRDDVAQELLDGWVRQSGRRVASDDLRSDAPSGLFRGLGLALIISSVLWLGITALVIRVI